MKRRRRIWHICAEVLFWLDQVIVRAWLYCWLRAAGG